jgi:glycoside/pentoside/hexuronide:cation symporter, GPH family
MRDYFGHGNNARGYQLTMGLFSALCVVFFIIAFSTTKERIQPDPQQKTSLRQDLADLFKNGPWIALFLVTTFYFMAISIRGSVMLPYFKYCAGNEHLFSWFNGFGLTALLIGVALSNSFSIRIGKRNLFILSMVLTAIFTVLLLVLPPTATVTIFGSEIIRQFAYGWSCPLLWAMMADVADFGEWKTGRRATATVTSAVVFALWAGLALGGALAGWLFAYYGYVPNAAQTPHALMGIRMTASVYAGLAFVLTAVCLLFYPITKETNLKIADDLAERRKSYAPATV